MPCWGVGKRFRSPGGHCGQESFIAWTRKLQGVILVAKNDAAHAKLGEAFRQRAIKKTYIALVQGILGEKSGRIELAIGRDPIHRTRMTTQRKSWHGESIAIRAKRARIGKPLAED